MKNLIISILAVLFTVSVASANDKNEERNKTVTLYGGGDLVSSYIWRGTYNAGASIQPSIGMKAKGFSLGAWGSVDFGGKGKKEVDLSANYSWKGVTIGITDYWWAGEGAFNYFNYKKGETSHLFEGNLSYQLPFKKFPLIVSWNTIFAGADYKANGDRSYSTYIELCYPFAVKSVTMKAIVGMAPWTSPAFLSEEEQGFNICNMAIAAEIAIRCSDKFSIPLFSQLIFNPATEDIHIVFGVSLKF